MALRSLLAFNTNTALDPSFNDNLRDVHLVYDYNAEDANGKPEKWRYKMWVISETRCVYKIHGGPMAGRNNYRTCQVQCINAGKLWQLNWLEKIGTICFFVHNIPNGTVTTLIAFLKGLAVSSGGSRQQAQPSWLPPLERSCDDR